MKQFRRLCTEVNWWAVFRHINEAVKAFQTLGKECSSAQYLKGGTEIEVNWKGKRSTREENSGPYSFADLMRKSRSVERNVMDSFNALGSDIQKLATKVATSTLREEKPR